jgi:uncharacterized protein involved in exopolysaccharide biosynthesis
MKFRAQKLFGVAALIAGPALCASGLWLLLSPSQYQATVRVQVGRDDPNVYNPYFIQTEFEIVKSDVVLSNVVEKLNLLEDWDGRGGTMAAAIHRLKQQTTVGPVRNVHLVMEIRVIDKNPETAARIANALAEAYCNLRIESNRQQRIRGIDFMESEYQKEAADISVQTEKINGLKKQLTLTNQGSAEAIAEPGYAAYTQAEHSLTNEEAIHQKREVAIASLKSHDNSRAAVASELGVKIVNPAVPPANPIGPNRALGVVLLICGLTISFFGFYLLFTAGSPAKTKP